jgi:hypothetical protein
MLDRRGQVVVRSRGDKIRWPVILHLELDHNPERAWAFQSRTGFMLTSEEAWTVAKQLMRAALKAEDGIVSEAVIGIPDSKEA